MVEFLFPFKTRGVPMTRSVIEDHVRKQFDSNSYQVEVSAGPDFPCEAYVDVNGVFLFSLTWREMGLTEADRDIFPDIYENLLAYEGQIQLIVGSPSKTDRDRIYNVLEEIAVQFKVVWWCEDRIEPIPSRTSFKRIFNAFYFF